MTPEEPTVQFQQNTEPQPLQQPELRHSTLLKMCPSGAMSRVTRLVQQCATDDCTVLLLGETGVGKEVAARAIHEQSRRAEKPMVEANCGGFTPTLIESELFGHERGAFTSAVQRRIGLVEQANEGTLFLDEIGELLKDNQTYLLRVLEGGMFKRLGGSEQLHSDFRLITATNRNLETAVEEGTLRRDLFYRLILFPIAISPLRERRDDIMPLAQYFTRTLGKKRGRMVTLAPGCENALLDREWKGNVRELKYTIERAIILAGKDAVILPAHLQNGMQAEERRASTNTPLRECTFVEHIDAIAQAIAAHSIPFARVKVLMCGSVLQLCGGNKQRAAQALALSRKTLYRLLQGE